MGGGGGGGGLKVGCGGGVSGLPSFNRIFKPVLSLACYVRYYLVLVSKPGLPRVELIKGVQQPYEF